MEQKPARNWTKPLTLRQLAGTAGLFLQIAGVVVAVALVGLYAVRFGYALILGQ